MANNYLTFRSSKIIYYGPHACERCGVTIARMGYEFGGNAFTYPEGPIYPNTEWHPHVCDPKRVAALPKAIPVMETRYYADGSSATGVAPLPDHSPAGAPEITPAIFKEPRDARAQEIRRDLAEFDPRLPVAPKSIT